VGTFPYEGEGWGLATDGASLILSDGSNVLRFIDPQGYARAAHGRRAGRRRVRERPERAGVGEAARCGRTCGTSRPIARIDPATGKVKSWLDLSQIALQSGATDPEAVPNGIAFDEASGRLFVTGKLWPALYEIRVPGVNAEAAPAGG
jgi:glutamine cyclotransferase